MDLNNSKGNIQDQGKESVKERSKSSFSQQQPKENNSK